MLQKVALRVLCCFALCISVVPQVSAKEEIRVGIIGCDTSHVPTFTKAINEAPPNSKLAGLKVIAAFPGGSADLPASRDRVQGYTETLRGMNVKIVDSIDELLPLVDAVLLESVDGRTHLAQARPVLSAGKPLFIDKPVAASLADATEIFALAAKHGTPCFSSSSLRYAEGVRQVRERSPAGRVLGCNAHSACELEPHHPDFFWYGIHGVEMLFAIMGPGCESVTRTRADGADVAVGLWKDGRIGVYRGIRAGKKDYGATVFGESGIVSTGGHSGYEPLLVEIAEFFRSRQAPVAATETLEIIAFMEAADESKRNGGQPVKLADLMDKARKVSKAPRQ